MKPSKEQQILRIIFKDFSNSYNSRNISQLIGVSHPGTFKIVKKIEARGILKSKKIGQANIYSIHTENPLAIKELELALLTETQNYKRWVEEFKALESNSEFVILFGSILKNEKEAKDIDLLVVADQAKIKEINKMVNEKQKLSIKKIHLLLQTKSDFKHDIEKKNKVMLEIIKTGVILSGQDKFIQTIK